MDTQPDIPDPALDENFKAAWQATKKSLLDFTAQYGDMIAGFEIWCIGGGWSVSPILKGKGILLMEASKEQNKAQESSR